MADARPDSELGATGMALLRERYYLGVDQTAVAGTVIVATVVALFWSRSSQTGLLVWAALMAVALPLPSIIKRLDVPHEKWFRLLVPCELLLGLMWGSIALLAMPADPVWQATLGAILVAIILAGSITSSQFTRAYAAFTGTVFGCAFAGFVIYGSSQTWVFLWLLPVAWVYGMTMASEQRQLQVDLVQSLLENQALVETLGAANAEAMRSNTKLADAVTKADRLARTDPLTQLANRIEFDEELTRQLADLGQGDHQYLTLAYLDLDNFKYINDSRGHRAGDLVLIAVSRRLCEIAVPGETFARLGGDELVLISRAFDPHDVGMRLLSVFTHPFVIEGRNVVVNASIGVGTVTEALDKDELMRRADAAQYRAKRAGGGSFVVFGSSTTPGSPGRVA